MFFDIWLREIGVVTFDFFVLSMFHYLVELFLSVGDLLLLFGTLCIRALVIISGGIFGVLDIVIEKFVYW